MFCAVKIVSRHGMYIHRILHTFLKYCEPSLTYILCDSQLTKLAKRLKKEKVTIDIVSFGETVSVYLPPTLPLYQLLLPVGRKC